MSAPRIHLHIDRLVLRGVEPAQREALVESLHAELRERLMLPGAARQLGRARLVATLPAKPTVVVANADAAGLDAGPGAGLGRHFGAALVAGLKP